MAILITGGAGFIGSNFVLRYVRGHSQEPVIVLDKLTYAANQKYLDPIATSIRFIHGDIADTPLVEALVKEHGIDTILNFAAETHVDRSIDDPSPFLTTNVLGVASLIEVCRRNSSIHLVHVSTDEVYGDLEDGERAKLPEDPLRPSSPYAASKAAGDLLLLAAKRTYGIRLNIIRCTNNYGPHQASEKFIPTVVRCALENQPIPIYSSGHNSRDWLFVEDHCAAIEQVLGLPADAPTILHIAANEERRNIDVAKMILDILGVSHNLLTSVPDRPGHDWRYALDASYLLKQGWKPRISFTEGIQRTINWYKQALQSAK